MTNPVIDRVEGLRLTAQNDRRKARELPLHSQERRALLARAEDSLKEAISESQTELESDELPPNIRSKLVALLSQTWGSLGGTRRDAKDYEAALEAYETGNKIEEERRNLGDPDSYNLVQRMVVRILAKTSLIDDEAFRSELAGVEAELERQYTLGRRDPWAIADIALVRFLRGQPADDVISNLESRKADTSFYESTREVVCALLAEGLGQGTELGNKLLNFQRLLERRGGLKPRAP